MDQDRLDRLARSLSGIASRREALRVVASSLLPAGAAVGMAPELDARKKKKKKKKKTCNPACQGDLTCVGGACICENGTVCGTRCCGAGQTCRDGACQGPCTPNCTDRVCGSDGCGGSCGSCAPGQTCRGGECLSSCVPNCFQKACGPDGCGGTCGNCIADEICEEGRCKPVDGGGTAPPPGGGGGGGGGGSCVPNCAGKTCGADGCGGSCGSCGAGQTCVSGICNGVTYEFRRAIPAEPAFRYDPGEIAYAPNGDLFVIDNQYNAFRVLRMNPSGELVSEWLLPTEEGTDSYSPNIAVSSNGEVVVTNFYRVQSPQSCGTRVRRYSSTGALLSSWTWLEGTSSCSSNPGAIALSSSGDLYSIYNSQVFHHSADGVLQRSWGSPTQYDGVYFSPTGVAIGPDGGVWVYSQGTQDNTDFRKILKFRLDGSYVSSLDLATSRWFNWYGTNALNVDSLGAIYLIGSSSIDERTWCKFGSLGEVVRESTVPGYGGAIAVAPNGIVALVNGNPYRIVFWNAAGQPDGRWNAYADGQGEFDRPTGITIDDQGRLFVLDEVSRRIQRFSQSGDFELEWTIEPPVVDAYWLLRDMKWDARGELVVAMSRSVDGSWRRENLLLRYTANGAYIGLRSLPEEDNLATAFAVDGQGNTYYLSSSKVTKLDSTGAVVLRWGERGETPGKFDYPQAIVIDADGTLLVLDTDNERVQRFTGEGAFLDEWGVPGTGKGMFDSPQGFSVDVNGYVYVADSANDRVQKFTSTGEYVTRFGSEGTGTGQFSWPTGTAVHPNGKVYVVDSDNRRVQIFEPVSTPLSQLKARKRRGRKRTGARKG